MWFGNFKHNVYQVATFHVRLRLGKEEVQQMRVKVWCFRSLCPVGLWWSFISQIVSLNPPKLGVGNSCCSPAGNGKHWCWKRSFAMKRRMPSYHSHLCLWRQVSPIGWDLQGANCSIHRHALSLDLTFLPELSFFFPHQYLWECAEIFLCLFEYEFHPWTAPGSFLSALVMHPYYIYSRNWEIAFPKQSQLGMAKLLESLCENFSS